ncbi:MAG: hypothetical protein HXK45_01310 [Atopobium sp.]|nr:hypothetical protein [Atopobium sp.]
MTNRQEVAKKLRENSTVHTTDEVYVALLSCTGITYDYANLLNRLADLIDPTCHVIDEEVTHEPTLNALAVHVYGCDKCGWHFYMAEVCCHPKPFYFPMCGARVVRDES